MHAWLDFITKLQQFTSFAFSWSPSEESKNLDAAVPDQVLAANAEAVAYQMEKDKNSGLVVIFWIVFNTRSTWHFHYYIYGLGKQQDNCIAVCFPSFHNRCNPTYTVWRREWDQRVPKNKNESKRNYLKLKYQK